MKSIKYQLRKEVYLIRQGEDFYLLSEIPLIVIKINKALYHLLDEMRRSGSVSYASKQNQQLIGLLNRLVAKGLLIKDEITETQTTPSISIIVPVKNRPQDIQECLMSLSSLDYPKDKVEIIVVNDGSTDSTAKVIQSFDIKAIHLPQSIGASACRNLAAREANGDLLGFTDSDCVPHPHWLRELTPYFDDERVGIVGGYVSNFYTRSLLDRYEAVKSSLNMGLSPFRVENDKSSTAYVPSCNLIIRRKAFSEIGGFQADLHVGEDVDLCWRTRKLGYHLLYVPRGEVKHKHRNNVRQMLMRRFDYGTSEALLYLRHKDKRKMLFLPALYFLFYGFICIGIIAQYPILFVIALAVSGIDLWRKVTKIRKTGLRLRNHRVFLSVLRTHFFFSYGTSSYLVRYYLIFLIPLSFIYPNLWTFVLFLLVFSAIADFIIKGPMIHFFSFFFFYILEQFAYQTGVLWGCIKRRNFMTYVPVIFRKPN
jgi:mycofactocin system glycosyltransferase